MLFRQLKTLDLKLNTSAKSSFLTFCETIKLDSRHLMEPNSCLTCGACCAFYRASFYWAEADDATEGGVPVDLTEKLNEFRRSMRGTSGNQPWCIALKGIIGAGVHCAIYERRSSVCRDFQASWANGEYNERCDRARAAWGMAPLLPGSSGCPHNFPKAA
jgi:uncharacterized protein